MRDNHDSRKLLILLDHENQDKPRNLAFDASHKKDPPRPSGWRILACGTEM
jgi:hypothetical protein